MAGAAVVITLVSVGWLMLAGMTGLLFRYWIPQNAVVAVGFALIVWLVIPGQPRNGAIWVSAWASLAAALYCLANAVFLGWNATVGGHPEILELAPSQVPFGIALVAQATTWLYVPATYGPLTLGLVLFPDGNAEGRFRRTLVWASIALIVASATWPAWMFRPSSTVPYSVQVDYEQLPLIEFLVVAVGFFAVSFLCLGALVGRYRESVGERRSQFRWVLWGASLAILVLVPSVAYDTVVGEARSQMLSAMIALVVLIGAYGIAIGKYRLYDIDLVISRTLVYGALALLISGLYVGIVVGLGSLLGLYAVGGQPNTVLGLAAIVVIPIVFQPARRRLERWANRVVFGRSVTPYEVLSGFSQNVAAVDPEVLTQLARSLAEGTTAEAASIWAGRGDDLQLVAAWPSDGDRLGGGVSEAAIVHDGEDLGRVVLVRAQGQALQPSDERLLAQVAAGLGLALRNRALTSDLEHRVEQLRDSRRRIVAVQDRTRRSLERNLHDGAQQRLVALKIKLGLATAVAGREHLDGVGVVLEGLRDQADTVIDSVREFARGIYPPLLEAEGLPAALSANFRKAPIPVSLQSAGVGRYPREVESTVYFCLLSAVSGSVARGSGSVHVMLEEDAGELVFEIRDDGSPAGPDVFLKILDRVDAAGGTVAADSRPGRGAIVECRLPLSEGVTGE
jgi:two-component system, NarL family, sensor kinase